MRINNNTDEFIQSGNHYRVSSRTVTITSADLTTAGLGPETENVGAVMINNFIPMGCRARLADAFTDGGGAATALTMTVGVAGDTDRFITAFDCFTGSSEEGAGWSQGTPNAQPNFGFPTTNTQAVATFTSTDGNLDTLADGSVTIEIWGFEFSQSAGI